MPVIHCAKCRHGIRIPEGHDRGRVKCPSCGTINAFGERSGSSSVISKTETPKPTAGKSAPSAAAAAKAPAGPTAARWSLKAINGQVYGPVDKAELDAWLAEGRISAECQLLREGDAAWQWASAVYPQLKPASGAQAAASTPSATSAPALPAAAPAIASQPTPTIRTGDAAAAGVSYRGRQYPMLVIAKTIFQILGWGVLVLGVLGGSVMLIGFFVTGAGFIAMGDAMAGMGAFAILTGLVWLLVYALYVALFVVSLWAAAEMIKLLIDMQDNTQRTAHLLKQLIAQQEARGN